MKTNQKGFSAVEIIIVLLVVGLIGGVGYMVYNNHNKKPATSSVANTTTTTPATTENKPATQAPDPYAGWKTYTLAEDKTISFKYPADWTVVADNKDTTSTPYNHFFKITDPTLYHNNDFVFIFRYSPGKNNALANLCSGGGYTNPVKSEDVTIGGKALKIVTTAGSIDNIKTLNMALVDSSNCTVDVPSGTISATENLGSQSAPTYSIDLNTFNSLPEAKTFDLIFKSVKF